VQCSGGGGAWQLTRSEGVVAVDVSSSFHSNTFLVKHHHHLHLNEKVHLQTSEKWVTGARVPP